MNKYLTWGGALDREPLAPNTVRFYLLVAALVAGNLIFPALVHSLPQGGAIFLPIYFFTLIAAYRFGIAAGLTTALLSPLVNTLLTGMPPVPVLDVIVVKSVAMAIVAAALAHATRQVSLLGLAAVIVGYQAVGGAYEALKAGSFQAALGDWVLGWPGLMLQLVGGALVLGLWKNRSGSRPQ
jgi:hypothetical protein